MKFKSDEIKILGFTYNRHFPGLVFTMLMGLIFAGFGLAGLLALSVPFGHRTVEGIVVGPAYTCRLPAKIAFEADGKQYVFEERLCHRTTRGNILRVDDPDIYTGMPVEIAYSPDNPGGTAKVITDFYYSRPGNLISFIAGAAAFITAFVIRFITHRHIFALPPVDKSLLRK